MHETLLQDVEHADDVDFINENDGQNSQSQDEAQAQTSKNDFKQLRPTAKKRKVDPVELEMLEALREKPNRHQSFFNSILPSLEDFDEFEVLEFQMDVLKSIKNIKQRKLCAAGVAVEGFKASRNLAHHQPLVDTPRAPQCNTGCLLYTSGTTLFL